MISSHCPFSSTSICNDGSVYGKVSSKKRNFTSAPKSAFTSRKARSQVVDRERCGVGGRHIPSPKLVEGIHMIPIDLVLAIHLAIAHDAQFFAVAQCAL